MNLRCLFLCVLSICVCQQFATAQGTLNSPTQLCLGDIANFSYTPPTGLTITSANWTFGDANGSTTIAPSHTYSNSGKYRLRVTVNFSNSTAANDSADIEVFDLPKAFFYMLPSDTCFNDHLICYRDTSSVAKLGQTIQQRLIVWGDGTFQTTTSPQKGDSVCHKYPVSSTYSLRMEITDNKGCKSSASSSVNVVENITANFFLKDTFVDCSTAQIFMYNKSFGTPNSRSHYRWLVDNMPVDTGFYFPSNFKRVNFTSTKSGKVSLVAYANNNCRDTLTKNYSVIIDPLPTEIFVDDTVYCNGDQSVFEEKVNKFTSDSLCWYYDNNPPFPPPVPQVYTFYFRVFRSGVGQHELKIKVFRGNCIHTVTKKITVLGPAPTIVAIDGKQCFGKRPMYFIDKTVGSKRENCKYEWTILDANGDTCLKHVAKGINIYQNCNRSKDWWIKHKFEDARDEYIINLYVKDTTNGCSDLVDYKVSTDYCSNILNKDTIHHCTKDIFKDQISQPVPDSISLDSGKSWFRFPDYLPKKYGEGIYDIGYQFKSYISPWAETIGTDSIKVHYDTAIYTDTIFKGQRLWVHGDKIDSVTYKIYGKCKPFRVSVFFKNNYFNKGDKLRVIWADKGNLDTTFENNSRFDSVMHVYNYIGLSNEIVIVSENEWGCQTVLRLPVEKGKNITGYTPRFINCHYNDVCINAYVFDMVTKKFWSSNTANNVVSWYFPSDNKTYNTLNACHKFKSYGMQKYQINVSDSNGCKDTLIDSVFIQRPLANLKKSGTYVFCNELKQFFDSSSYLVNPKNKPFLPVFYQDSVKRYSWRFGDGVYNSFQKNPVQSINTSLDSIQASHVIEMVSGCTDTVHFTIKSIGPKPYFHIRDTIGCGQLTATFINKSRNSKNYIWQFGDSSNTQILRSDKQDIQFTYTKPGRYFISLIGVDTVFNPFTQRNQACAVSFPDKLFQKDTNRSVLVLTHRKTGINTVDTICSNTPFLISSLSDNLYDGDKWDLGDSTLYDTTARQTISHRYTKNGTYLIHLKPYYNNSKDNLCKDSAQKTIVVMGVEADFDVDAGSVAPQFKFNNKSLPASSALNWNFGFNGPGNTSTDQNPSVNYGNDTGTYRVCLIASIPYGCADTICKNVFNDYLSDFGIYNVFTPSNKDGLNDVYDIVIEGEATYDLKIYNRWGVLVFESDKDASGNEDGNWNGKVFNTGAECPSGTYYFIFNYSLKGKPDTIESIQGVIQLIR